MCIYIYSYMYSHGFSTYTSGFDAMCVTKKSNVITWEKMLPCIAIRRAILKALKAQPKLSFHAQSSDEVKRTEAELRLAVLTAVSNVPLAFHDQLSPTIRKVFPDSKIASKYQSASTKATCMLNKAVAPILINDLLTTMKTHPFSISIDGSNDTDLEKMNPIMVRICDVKSNMVVNRFLDMCATTSATTEGIYSVMNGKLGSLLNSPNPWMLCTSVGVDNTSVNIGVRDPLKQECCNRIQLYILMVALAILSIMLHRKQGKLLQMFVDLMLKSMSLIYTIGSINPPSGRMGFSRTVCFASRNTERL